MVVQDFIRAKYLRNASQLLHEQLKTGTGLRWLLTIMVFVATSSEADQVRN